MLPYRLALSVGILCLLISTTSAQENKSFKGLSSQEYQAKFDDLVPQGFIPVDVRVKVKRGKDFYDLKMEKPARKIGWAAHHRMTAQSFDEKKSKYEKRNMEVDVKRSYKMGATRYFVAIWKATPPRPTIQWRSVKQVPISGPSTPQLIVFDQMMTQFLVQNQLPGATLAVSRNGKVIYQKGFGYQDVDRKQPMPADALLRIASISKPITAVAILQLVEQGKLKLDDKVFEILTHQPKNEQAKRDPRLNDITVQHCLQHTAGWDRGVSFDPMFRPQIISKDLGVDCPPGPDNIIRYMLNQSLDHAPGTKYAYSNFGYNVLGRVIEQVSGMDYDSYVVKNVLKPVGAGDMAIGATLAKQRNQREPKYYVVGNPSGEAVVGELGKSVLYPYGVWHLEAMDAHGGWIASAADLVKFASAFDSPDTSSLLSPISIETMFERPPGKPGLDKQGEPTASYYGMGWRVRPVHKSQNTWHSGSLSGTSTLLVRRSDGLNWAVLFNQRNCPDGKPASAKIDVLLHRAANAVKRWPN